MHFDLAFPRLRQEETFCLHPGNHKNVTNAMGGPHWLSPGSGNQTYIEPITNYTGHDLPSI